MANSNSSSNPTLADGIICGYLGSQSVQESC